MKSHLIDGSIRFFQLWRVSSVLRGIKYKIRALITTATEPKKSAKTCKKTARMFMWEAVLLRLLWLWLWLWALSSLLSLITIFTSPLARDSNWVSGISSPSGISTSSSCSNMIIYLSNQRTFKEQNWLKIKIRLKKLNY